MSRFTSLVGCRVPLQLAGMGGVGSVELAAAVSRAGGLGMLPVLGEPIGPRVERVLASAGSEAVVGVNVLLPFLAAQREGILEAAVAGARVVELFYDDPDAALVEAIHAMGPLVSWQVGSIDEARAAVDAGVDIVVGQGVEAGGHVRGVTPLHELLDQLVGADLDVPIVAAGGIATEAQVTAAFERGADAVRVGTAFLATPEADVHPQYLERLLRADGDATVLTTEFDAGWPDAPHRVLRSALAAMSTRSPSPPTRAYTADVAGAALYAGTGVGDVTAVEPAEDVVRRLVAGVVS